MKRYYVFGGETVVQSFGWASFRGSYADPDEAVEAAKREANTEPKWSWWQVADSYLGTIVDGMGIGLPGDLAKVNAKLSERVPA